MADKDSSGSVCRFAHEVGYLKRLPRAGWLVAGVSGQVESVAEHSHRVSILAHIIAASEGANPDRAAALGAYHDVHETRIGDIPHLWQRYLTATEPRAITKDQVDGLPAIVAAHVCGLVTEFEAGESPEAVAARDADRLECLLQAVEYGAAGTADLSAWVESSRAKLCTETAQMLANDALAGSPGDWWRTAQGGLPPAQ